MSSFYDWQVHEEFEMITGQQKERVVYDQLQPGPFLWRQHFESLMAQALYMAQLYLSLGPLSMQLRLDARFAHL